MSKVASIIPPGSELDISQARRASNAMRDGRPMTGNDVLPSVAIAALDHLLSALATGDGAAILPLDAELTTQEAADLLGVSRPTLVKLLETGALAFRTIGVHRRIRTADLVAYRDQERRRQDAALDELVALNQAAGLYD